MTLTERHLGRIDPHAVFLVLAAALCTAVLVVLSTQGYWERPGIVAPALMADLALGLPGLGYLSLVRTRRRDRSILLPLFLLGAFLARWWIPEAHQMGSRPLVVAAVALEAALLVYLVLRIRRIRSFYTVEKALQPYPLDAARLAFTRVLGRRLGAVVLGEGAALWYSLTAWRRHPAPVKEGTRFPGHRRNAYPALLGAILVLIVVETGVVHLLVALWSPRVAWGLSALGVYTVLWLLGDFHAARLNQTLVGPTALHLRTGLRWHADVPWSRIRSVRTDPPPTPAVKMALLGKPDFWLEFTEPQTIAGIMGFERRVEAVGLGLDDPGAFLEQVEPRVEAVRGARGTPPSPPWISRPIPGPTASP